MSCACGRHKNAAGCAGARHLRTFTKARRQQLGHEGGKANAVVDRAEVLERYIGLDRDDAIWQAWKDARRMEAWRRYRARRPRGNWKRR